MNISVHYAPTLQPHYDFLISLLRGFDRSRDQTPLRVTCWNIFYLNPDREERREPRQEQTIESVTRLRGHQPIRGQYRAVVTNQRPAVGAAK